MVPARLVSCVGSGESPGRGSTGLRSPWAVGEVGGRRAAERVGGFLWLQSSSVAEVGVTSSLVKARSGMLLE